MIEEARKKTVKNQTHKYNARTPTHPLEKK